MVLFSVAFHFGRAYILEWIPEQRALIADSMLHRTLRSHPFAAIGLFVAFALASPPVPGFTAPRPDVTADTPADAPGEVYFVFGSDTSTGGLRVSEHSNLFRGYDINLYVSPSEKAARIMEDALRDRLADWYGEPLRMTWWMQGGSIYQQATNTNVPLGSTLPTYLMQKYHGDAVERHGDEMTFHYHTWVWSDYSRDGVYYWNQAKRFEESREDFDLSVAQHLIEEGVFPVSFRSGWHYMDNAWQLRLDELLPFSLHNDAPAVRRDQTEPIDNVFDWGHAPLDFVPFRPSADDYQLPGGTGGWNVRSVHLTRVHENLLRQIFEAAANGESQVPCLWSHLAETDFVEQVERVVELIREVAAEYPDVPYRFTTAVDGMQRWLGTTDRQPPQIQAATTTSGSRHLLTVTTDEPLFQPHPFIAVKDRYERYHVVSAEPAGPETWTAELPHPPELLARVAIAATDSSGNLATKMIDFVPGDIVVDNRSGSYEELSGTWETVRHTELDQVWGEDVRISRLTANESVSVRWRTTVPQAATYDVFWRTPALRQPVEEITIQITVGGRSVEVARFDRPLSPDDWIHVGTVDLETGQDVSIEAEGRAAASGQSFAADAVKLSPLIRDRQLTIPGFLEAGDLITGREQTIAIPVRNLGNERLTITGVHSDRGIAELDGALPMTLDGFGRAEMSMRISYDGLGDLQDAIYFESDDPVRPVLVLPFRARFMPPFVIVDNDDDDGYSEDGTWQNSVTQAYGSSSRWAGTGSPMAAATFVTGVERQGWYDLSNILPRAVNSALRARHEVFVDGVLVDDRVLDQNDGSGNWRSIGLYRVNSDASVRLKITWADTDQTDHVLRADAIRLAFLGEELRDIIADNDDPQAYEERGEWSTSVAEAHGESSRYAPLSADSRATFHFLAERTALHALQMIVPDSENASRRARYRVFRNGVLIDAVFIDQNFGDDQWRQLGSYLIQVGDSVSVELSHAGSSTDDGVLRADALRMRFAGDVSTAIEHGRLPDAPKLGQNIPNPMRAHTQFEYVLPEAGPVLIELYDALGRRVATLVNDVVPAGRHRASFDASHLASGVYFCRMQAASATEVQTWVVAR